MTEKLVLALDQGTTSSRAIVFDAGGSIRGLAQQEFPQITPHAAHVEHDPEAIWDSQLETARGALRQAGIDAEAVAAIGITNQRETTVLWERDSGRPLHHAIVWQSRITKSLCDRLRSDGYESLVQQRTGLLIDPYFSATKIRWLLDRDPSWQARAERGEILFGTIDSFLIWRLTGGRVHVTDYSNASRTMLLNIHELAWDDELLAMLRIPRAMLPELCESSGVVGETDPQWFGRAIPIAGVAGDQQAATFGQACFEPGMAKNTYGTGCFVLLNIGNTPKASAHRLLTTVGWVIDGQVTYCQEGAIFVAGAAVQWLRDGLGLVAGPSEAATLAAEVPDSGGVVFVPAFVGLGAPHWDPAARGLIIGLSRNTTAAHVARAALEAMAFQTRDVLAAMQADGLQLRALRVDGGAAVNDALMQFQADMLDVPVERPRVFETTALGAAYLAGLAVEYWKSLDEIANNWTLGRTFTPRGDQQSRQRQYALWCRAVERSKAWELDA